VIVPDDLGSIAELWSLAFFAVLSMFERLLRSSVGCRQREAVAEGVAERRVDRDAVVRARGRV
jgi:hypothetical protein